MKASSRPVPDWLKWVMRISGVILPLCSLLFASRIWLSISAIRKGFSGPKALPSQQMQTLLVQVAADVTIVFILVALGIWLYRRSRAAVAVAEPTVSDTAETTPVPVVPSKPKKSSARDAAKRWHSCNVLYVGPAARQLWQFDSRFALSREHTAPTGDSLPGNLVKKTWRSLGQPKLNVAWLPPENVFLRVVQLPESSFDETLSMVELQLEKLSPIPVTQVVWSVHPLPGTVNGLQTLIVVFAERKAVEEFLGQLEGQGYLADRLELSALDQLQATPIKEDGAWIYPGGWGGHEAALVAWWYGGVLRNLNFITAAGTDDRAANLKEQLAQTTWAGELAGWLTSPPTWHLVANDTEAAAWETPLRKGLGEPITVTAPLNSAQLAALTARRSAKAESQANLLPAEFATRYHQQFVDQLWLRGLGAIGAVYAVGIAIYFAALSFQLYRVSSVESDVKGLSLTYTNAVQLKARYQVLKEREELKFAALDCWKTVAELLPETLTLDGFNLIEGRKLVLSGSAPSGEGNAALDFVKAMRKATINGQPMFDETKSEHYNARPTQNPAVMTWNFDLELKRAEVR